LPNGGPVVIIGLARHVEDRIMPRCHCYVTVAILTLTSAAPAADAPLPPDLALVPPGAAGFVHVRVADLCRSEHFGVYRQFLGKAGEDVIRAFNDHFVPSPKTVDRITVFVNPPAGGRNEPEVVAIITTSAPFDKDRLLKSFVQGVPKQSGNVYTDERDMTAVYVPGDRLFAFGTPGAIAKLTDRRPAEGPLAPALAIATGGKPFVAAGNTAWIPAEALQHAPPQIQPFVPLMRAKFATLVADFDNGTHLDLRMRYADARAADEAEEAAKNALSKARQGLSEGQREMQKRLTDPNLPNPRPVEQLPEAAGALAVLAAINQADEFLGTLPLRKEGAELRLDVTLPRGPASLAAAGSALSVGLLLPAVQKVREAASRTKDQNNLKQIALAMHNYHSAENAFPPHAIYSKDGRRPLLSWRVAILPYLEQEALYHQFKLNEPWDSPNNKPLVAKMPEVYAMPNAPPTKEPGMTYYQVFVGKGAAWEKRPKGFTLVDFTDGTSNTILVAEAAEPVFWTKPDDLAFDPDKPLPKLNSLFGKACNVAFADGSVRRIPVTINPKTLKALITRNGGEAIDFSELDR
jgi:prepilin-type processing-associated H-X9-DG protein